MNRLQSELCRLYLPNPGADLVTDNDPAPSGLVDAQGRVRALVLELTRPADWALLSKVWRGVQSDLELPAPAIAVSGTDGFQLWFSLAQPVGVAQAQAFLALLCRYFLPDVAGRRLRLLPVADAAAPQQVLHAQQVPARQAQGNNWSAFVAPDLAPVFAETPWLDTPPSDDGQADLLSRLTSIKPPAWEAALAQLQSAVPQAGAARDASSSEAGHVPATPLAAAGSLDAKRFLLRVMNDDSVALALRIEAAKALLPYADEPRPPPGN